MKSIVLSRVRRVDAYKIEEAVPKILKGGEKVGRALWCRKKESPGKVGY